MYVVWQFVPDLLVHAYTHHSPVLCISFTQSDITCYHAEVSLMVSIIDATSHLWYHHGSTCLLVAMTLNPLVYETYSHYVTTELSCNVTCGGIEWFC